MSITLIAVVVALVLGHAAPGLAGLRQYDWYANWVRWLGSRLGEGSFWRGRWGLVLALLPPLLLVVLFQVALDAPLLGLAWMLFGIAVLFVAQEANFLAAVQVGDVHPFDSSGRLGQVERGGPDVEAGPHGESRGERPGARRTRPGSRAGGGAAPRLHR